MLQAPKRLTTSGQSAYYLSANSETIRSPILRFEVGGSGSSSGGWMSPTPEWVAWAETTRNQLIGEIVSHGTWFSRPPRRETIESLFTPWAGKDMQGQLQLFCNVGHAPTVNCSASLGLKGLTMSATGITPDWDVLDIVETEAEADDKISLFGDVDQCEKEIQISDIESAPTNSIEPTKLRSRVWEEKRFMAKERVREARLKAQIAEHIAAREEERFFKIYGDLEENESQFSEYDLSEKGSISGAEENDDV